MIHPAVKKCPPQSLKYTDPDYRESRLTFLDSLPDTLFLPEHSSGHSPPSCTLSCTHSTCLCTLFDTLHLHGHSLGHTHLPRCFLNTQNESPPSILRGAIVKSNAGRGVYNSYSTSWNLHFWRVFPLNSEKLTFAIAPRQF